MPCLCVRAVSSARTGSRNTSRGPGSRGPSRPDSHPPPYPGAPAQNGGGPHSPRGQRSPRGVSPGSGLFPRAGPWKRMVAIYEYDPQTLSPNTDSEVSATPVSTARTRTACTAR